MEKPAENASTPNRITAGSIFGILRQSLNHWIEDNALRLSAALAYYSIFSIAPLLIIAIAIAGWVLDQDTARRLLDEQLQALLGGQVAQGVQGMIESGSKPSSSAAAGVIGAITLLIGASGVFAQLKDALNTIWEVRAKPGQGIKNFIRERLLSFGMVLVIGFLLLISLLMTTVLSAFGKYVGNLIPMPQGILTAFGSLLSFGMVTVLFAAIFKVLPDVKTNWGDLWMGAVVTALLFEVGKLLLGLYLGREAASSAYGPAGAAVLVLLWVYYASLILFFGAEFTRVNARSRGSHIEPRANAEFVTAETRAQPGLAQGLSPAGGHGVASAPHRESLSQVLGIDLVTRQPPETFAEKNAFLVMLGAVFGGLAIGVATRRAPGIERSAVDEVKHGTSVLAAEAVEKTGTFLSALMVKFPAALEWVRNKLASLLAQ